MFISRYPPFATLYSLHRYIEVDKLFTCFCGPSPPIIVYDARAHTLCSTQNTMDSDFKQVRPIGRRQWQLVSTVSLIPSSRCPYAPDALSYPRTKLRHVDSGCNKRCSAIRREYMQDVSPVLYCKMKVILAYAWKPGTGHIHVLRVHWVIEKCCESHNSFRTLKCDGGSLA